VIVTLRETVQNCVSNGIIRSLHLALYEACIAFPLKNWTLQMKTSHVTRWPSEKQIVVVLTIARVVVRDRAGMRVNWPRLRDLVMETFAQWLRLLPGQSRRSQCTVLVDNIQASWENKWTWNRSVFRWSYSEVIRDRVATPYGLYTYNELGDERVTSRTSSSQIRISRRRRLIFYWELMYTLPCLIRISGG